MRGTEIERTATSSTIDSIRICLPCGRRSRSVRHHRHLALRPIAGITIDPLIALPVGGIVGAIAMGKTRDMGHYFTAGLAKMSGVAMLLVGTGALAGIISNSSLKDVIISCIETLGLPAFMLAPIAGMMMGAAHRVRYGRHDPRQPDLRADRSRERHRAAGCRSHDQRERIRL